MREVVEMKSIGVPTWRRRATSRCRASRRRMRVVLRLAFVGVVLASGAQDPRPFAGEPSGGRYSLVGLGAVGRGSGSAKDRQGASTGRRECLAEGVKGRGDRTAGRGPVPASTLIHEHKVCKDLKAC
jgi:hypothetical protein